MTSLRYAIRSLTRAPLLTASVALTIGLGIACTTAVFSVAYAALFRHLPYPRPDRLVSVEQLLQGETGGRINSRALPALRASIRSLQRIAGFQSHEFSLTGSGEPERVEGVVATASLFDVLGTRPSMGRAFTEAEETLGRDEVVVIGHRVWQTRFGGSRAVLGRTLGVDGVPHVVVGVLPENFRLVLPDAPSEPALITPYPHGFWNKRKWMLLSVVACLEEHATVASAHAEVSAFVRRRGEMEPQLAARTGRVTALSERVAGPSRPLLVLLLGATGAVLLVGCLNVANLLLVRATGRQREMAVRAALGAGSGRLAGQLLIESILLATIGGLLGVLAATWCVDLFVALIPENLVPRLDEVRLDLPVLAVALVLASLTGVLAGLVPAWHAFRWERRGVLGESLTTLRPSASGGRRRLVRRMIVATEVAVAMVLLVGAGLLARTYVSLTRSNLGVAPERVLTFRLTLPPAKYAKPEARLAAIDRLLERLRAVPGVESAATTNSLPVRSAMTLAMGIFREGGQKTDPEFAPVRTVSPQFFETMGIALVRGRLFDDRDTNAKVAIVNETLARRMWGSDPGGATDPVGRILGVGNNTCRIAGVVRDVRYEGPGSTVEPEVYVPHGYFPTEYVVGVVKASGRPLSLAPGVRTAVKAVDADLPIEALRTLEQVVAASVAPPRFRFALVGMFALFALLLAVVGLYGVVAHSVGQRAREIGIRIALGSGRPAILSLVLGEAFAVVGAGVALGVAASLALTRVLSTFLFGVTATDTATLAAVAAVLLLSAGAASLVPARAAASIDPVVALRAE